jgi:hypothetical protein
MPFSRSAGIDDDVGRAIERPGAPPRTYHFLPQVWALAGLDCVRMLRRARNGICWPRLAYEPQDRRSRPTPIEDTERFNREMAEIAKR